MNKINDISLIGLLCNSHPCELRDYIIAFFAKGLGSVLKEMALSNSIAFLMGTVIGYDFFDIINPRLRYVE